MLDTLIGYVMKDSQDEGAKLRLPQRQLNFMDSQISAYCQVLNSPERLIMIRQANEVAGIIGDLEVDRLNKRNEAKKKNDELNIAKEAHRKAKDDKDLLKAISDTVEYK